MGRFGVGVGGLGVLLCLLMLTLVMMMSGLVVVMRGSLVMRSSLLMMLARWMSCHGLLRIVTGGLAQLPGPTA
jgi:hypothetical protein